MIYGLLTVMAICVSAWAPRDERIAAYWSGVVILTGWGLWMLSVWTMHGPAMQLHKLGVTMDPIDIWAITDLATAALILLIAGVRWWSVALWALLSVQIGLHCCYTMGAMIYGPYEAALDLIYLGQLAVLFAIGGSGAVDYLLDWYRGIGLPDAPDKARSAQTEAAAQ